MIDEKLAGRQAAPRLTAFGTTQLRRLRTLRASGLIWVLVIMCAVAALVSDAFLNPFNIINVLRQIALFGIVSVGMTYVILTAGIDLSVGSIVAVVAVTSAMMLDSGLPIPLVILTGLVIGVLIGAVNGLGIALDVRSIRRHVKQERQEHPAIRETLPADGPGAVHERAAARIFPHEAARLAG